MPKPTKAEIIQWIDDQITVEERKKGERAKEKNAKKVELHQKKSDGLKALKTSLEAIPDDQFDQRLKSVIKQTVDSHPRLIEGVSSAIKAYFKKIAPDWTSAPSPTLFPAKPAARQNEPVVESNANLPFGDYKIVLLGDIGVGKDAISHRYTKNVFPRDLASTVGVDFFVKTLETPEKPKLTLWSVSGNPRYSNIAQAYIERARAVILMFDLTRKETFKKIDFWFEGAKRWATEAPIILVGNKSDLQDKREVTTEEAKTYAKNNGMIYHEVSAKDNVQIEELFETVVQQLKETPSAAPSKTL